MEGDAGASRLNPADADDSSSLEVKSEDSPSEATAEDSSESEVGADQTSTETTAEGFVATNAEDESETAVDSDTAADVRDESEGGDSPVDAANPSRLGREWFVGITAALLVVAGGVGTAGYFALRSSQESQAIVRHDAEAVQAAKECIAVTQAPDVEAMAAGAQRIIDCSTGDFRAQAVLYSSLFVQAYQAANVHVQVSDLRAAAERRNDDGSVDVLVALRIKVSNAETQNREIGYRLRVKMSPNEGQYRIAKLDQVAK